MMENKTKIDLKNKSIDSDNYARILQRGHFCGGVR